MRAAVVNDDGYEAEGLRVLVETVRKLGDCQIVAPLTVQSQTSHAVSLSRPIALHAIDDERLGRLIAVDGRPADCTRVVLAGLEGLERPDWLLSGINHGANLGVDLLYSGTVAAAREAALHGLKAIAFSQLIRRPAAIDWAGAATMAERALRAVIERGVVPGTFWNVNLPAVDGGFADVPIVETRVDWEPLGLVFEAIETPAGALATSGAAGGSGRYYQYAGRYIDRARSEDGDVGMTFAGRITLSRVSVHD